MSPGLNVLMDYQLPNSKLLFPTLILGINTFRPIEDGCHFPDDIFKYIFLNENEWIFVTISLKFVPKDSIDNIPSSVQIMAIIWTNDGLVYWRIYAFLGLHELNTDHLTPSSFCACRTVLTGFSASSRDTIAFDVHSAACFMKWRSRWKCSKPIRPRT